MMIMIRAIVRPEKADEVLEALMDAGFPSITKYSVAGRGKQRGIKIGEVTYDEIPKTMLMSVVKAEDKDLSWRQSWRPPAPRARALSATARYSSASVERLHHQLRRMETAAHRRRGPA